MSPRPNPNPGACTATGCQARCRPPGLLASRACATSTCRATRCKGRFPLSLGSSPRCTRCECNSSKGGSVGLAAQMRRAVAQVPKARWLLVSTERLVCTGLPLGPLAQASCPRASCVPARQCRCALNRQEPQTPRCCPPPHPPNILRSASHNQLEGALPRSLASCKSLMALELQGNPGLCGGLPRTLAARGVTVLADTEGGGSMSAAGGPTQSSSSTSSRQSNGLMAACRWSAQGALAPPLSFPCCNQAAPRSNPSISALLNRWCQGHPPTRTSRLQLLTCLLSRRRSSAVVQTVRPLGTQLGSNAAATARLHARRACAP